VKDKDFISVPFHKEYWKTRRHGFSTGGFSWLPLDFNEGMPPLILSSKLREEFLFPVIGGMGADHGLLVVLSSNTL
jgi:hypothetical protein